MESDVLAEIAIYEHIDNNISKSPCKRAADAMTYL